MPAILEDAEQNISPRMRTLLARIWQEWKQLDPPCGPYAIASTSARLPTLAAI
jgi:hypothetical protein